MKMTEFVDVQASKGWRRFLCLSENQESYATANPVKVNLTFQEMRVTVNPNAILLKGTDGWLRLDFVTAVDCTPHVLGDVLDITCGGGQKYTVIAQ